MNEKNLRQILGNIGIQPGRANHNGWMEFPCPLAPWTHANGHDTRASAAAKVSEGGTSAFKCQACHQHGRISKLVRLLAEYRQDDSIRQYMLLADRADAEAQVIDGYPDFEDVDYGDPLPEPLDDAAYGDIYPPASEHERAVEYLAGRNISPETADRLGLMYDDGWRTDEETGRPYQTADRVVFPVRDAANNLYGFTGRAIDPGVKIKVRDYYGLPKKSVILGGHLWEHGKPMLIVEGLFAYAHLHEIGMAEHFNIGALLGSAMTEHKADILILYDEPIYLLLDNDAGGDIGLFGTLRPDGSREENGAVHYLQEHVPLFVPTWPEGKDDPDQLTAEEVLRMKEETPRWTNNPTHTLDEAWDKWV